MKARTVFGVVMSCLSLGLASCQQSSSTDSTGGQLETNTITEKRIDLEVSPASDGAYPGHTVPAIITYPKEATVDNKIPAVVMLHGTASNKDEAGDGYKIAAPFFAQQGIASIRIDFIGTGDSKTDYSDYSYTSAVADAMRAYDAIKAEEYVDPTKISVMGWSQGGTIALLAAGRNPSSFSSVLTWSGAYDLRNLVSDEANGYVSFEEAKRQADQQGYYDYKFSWRDPLHLGQRWFHDVATIDVLKEFSSFTGRVEAIVGTEDVVVPPQNGNEIIKGHEGGKVFSVQGGDHTFLALTGDYRLFHQVVNESASFLLGGDGVSGSLSYTEEKIFYPTVRAGVSVPAIVTLPRVDDGRKIPFVFMLHGHGGSKEEGKGFGQIARALANLGVGSLRMDFPGTGESKEDFTINTLSNMKDDVKAGYEYIQKNNVLFDAARVGLFGYSMGGRLALEIVNEALFPVRSLSLLAPAADTEDLKNLFGGATRWEELKKEANANGYANFTTIYGQQQKLSATFFSDLERYKTSQVLTDGAKAKFSGKSQVLWSIDDEAVSPLVSQGVATNLNSQIVNTSYDGHSYGFYPGADGTYADEVRNTVSGAVSSFFQGL